MYPVKGVCRTYEMPYSKKIQMYKTYEKIFSNQKNAFWLKDKFVYHYILYHRIHYRKYLSSFRWKDLSYCVSICLCINVTCLKPCMTRDNVTCWYNWHIHIYKTYIQLLCVHTSFKILRKMKKDNNSGFQLSQHIFIVNPKTKHWIDIQHSRPCFNWSNIYLGR